MRETSFIQQNKEKWDEFEKKFESEKDPEKVSNLFIQITDDLSYSRTYYPNRSVKIYLNTLAQKVFRSIYKNKVRRRSKFALFWKEELPQKMFEARWQVLFSFALFMIAFFIGVFSSMHDPEFARFILGDDYVSMTEANIKSGDPMLVYKEMNQFDMLLGIAFNNLWVSFLLLAFGIFFGLGTAYFILFNGIMIGAFQYFFIERGLFLESFLAIWVHGALEVSAIVIAGTAGFTLGKGLLFPGTYTRLQSFRIHGLRAVQIFLGITPIIVLAAINESFLTRLTDTPDIVRGFLIAVELSFMVFYFVIYPARKAKHGFNTRRRSDEIPADKTPEFNLQKIKNNGEVFSDSVLILRQFAGPILITVFFLAVAYCAVYFRPDRKFCRGVSSDLLYRPQAHC
ncbi:MAG: stage II sporulation protein M [Chitinophagales bacterium]